MQVEVLFFGSLTDATQTDAVMIEGVTDTLQLQQALVKKFPALANAKYLLAVNKKMIKEVTELHHADTIACMPPFSGG